MNRNNNCLEACNVSADQEGTSCLESLRIRAQMGDKGPDLARLCTPSEGWPVKREEHQRKDVIRIQQVIPTAV